MDVGFRGLIYELSPLNASLLIKLPQTVRKTLRHGTVLNVLDH